MFFPARGVGQKGPDETHVRHGDIKHNVFGNATDTEYGQEDRADDYLTIKAGQSDFIIAVVRIHGNILLDEHECIANKGYHDVPFITFRFVMIVNQF